MKRIPNESIKKWAYSNSNKLSHPVSVAAICPACSLNVVFNTKRRLYDANRDTSSCSSDCPACNSVVHFWVVDMVAHARQDGEGDPGVYMLPSPHEHIDIQEHEPLIPEEVMQYCSTAQDIYFSGNMIATNVLVKTALEAIFEDFLPLGNSRIDLSQMIRDSIKTINAAAPLNNLVHSAGKEGELAQLFRGHHSTDQATADAMMELMESLIIYLYVMPARFNDLEQRFKALCEARNAPQNQEPVSRASQWPDDDDINQHIDDLLHHDRAGPDRAA